MKKSLMAEYITDFVEEDLTGIGGRGDEIDVPLLNTDSINVTFRKSYCPYQPGNNQLKDSSKEARLKIIVAASLCFLFMIIELLGGYFAGSLAIMADAAHLLSDCTGFIIGLLAIWISGKPPDHKMSFGYKRIEVLGAIISILAIWFLTAFLFYVAVERIITKQFDINANTMMGVAGVGIVINIIMALILHGSFKFNTHCHIHSHFPKQHNEDMFDDTHSSGNGEISVANFVANRESSEIRPRQGSLSNRDNHKLIDNMYSVNRNEETILQNELSHEVSFAEITPSDSVMQDKSKLQTKENINLRAALIHVIGDFIQSVGVFIAAIVIKLNPDAKIADPICTLLFSVIVILTTIKIIKESVNVMLDAVPSSIHLVNLIADLTNIAGVKSIHDLKVWGQTIDHNYMMAHITIDEFADSNFVLKSASTISRTKYNIQHSTFQIERINSHDN